MRDPDRIVRILRLLEVAWYRAPDLRFGQLVENVLKIGGPGNHCIYSIEDDVTEKTLKEYLNI